MSSTRETRLEDRFVIAVEEADWMAEAECRHHLDVDFFPTRGDQLDPAKAICASCSVAFECLEHALDFPEYHGVWGGTSERERERLRRRMRKVAS